MALELIQLGADKDKGKDKGEEFEIGLEDGRVEIDQDEVKQQDPKQYLSYWDNEDRRLYDVFQDTPEIVDNYIK